ncbi:hypothetical protein KR222_007876 [Zaprionus bogoriensis]|nr:hypothetical protein KR222_007876 [Zaprionus bogoriensis]
MSLDGAQLNFVNGAGVAVAHAAKGRKFNVGSFLGCDLVLPDAERLHCEIHCDAYGRVTIQNHSQDKPISVNDQVTHAKRPLPHGARIQILNEVYTWHFPRANDRVTPERLPPDQAPHSSPTIKGHRQRRQFDNRLTVHNFRYSINSDDEGNTSIESREVNANAEKPLSAVATAESAASAESTASVDATATAESTASVEATAEPTTSAKPKRSTTPPVKELDETTSKVDLVEATQDKENTSTQSNKLMLQLCARSDLVITSFSPRQAGVRIEKSFTRVVKPSTGFGLNSSTTTTPKSVYNTPKGVLSELNDDSCSRDPMDFSTPSTSKKASAINRESSMYLIDLTTPQKLRPTLSTTPRATPGSAVSEVISVNSTDEFSDDSPIVVDSGLSTPASSTPARNIPKRTAMKTPKEQLLAAGSTPKRTPQSLMKRALLTSAKKQISANNRTPKTPVTASNVRQSLLESRRQCLTAPRRLPFHPQPQWRTPQRRPGLAALTGKAPQTSPRKRSSLSLSSPRDNKISLLRKSLAAAAKISPTVGISNKLVAKARRALNSPKNNSPKRIQSPKIDTPNTSQSQGLSLNESLTPDQAENSSAELSRTFTIDEDNGDKTRDMTADAVLETISALVTEESVENVSVDTPPANKPANQLEASVNEEQKNDICTEKEKLNATFDANTSQEMSRLEFSAADISEIKDAVQHSPKTEMPTADDNSTLEDATGKEKSSVQLNEASPEKSLSAAEAAVVENVIEENICEEVPTTSTELQHEEVVAILEDTICEEVPISEEDTPTGTTDEHEDNDVIVIAPPGETPIPKRRSSRRFSTEQTATSLTPRRSVRRASVEASHKIEQWTKPTRRNSCSAAVESQANATTLATPKRKRRLTEELSTPTRKSLRLLCNTPKRTLQVDDAVDDMGVIVEEDASQPEAAKSPVPVTDEDYGSELPAKDVDEPDKIDYHGMRELLKTPKSCSTPHFKGLRELIRTPKVHPSPMLDNIDELLEPGSSDTPKRQLTVGRVALELSQSESNSGDAQDLYFKTPRGKNLMIPNEPASAVLKSQSSLATATEYDLNATNATLHLDKIFDDVLATDASNAVIAIDESENEINVTAINTTAASEADPLGSSDATIPETSETVRSEALFSVCSSASSRKDPLTSTTFKQGAKPNLEGSALNAKSSLARATSAEMCEMSGIHMLDQTTDSMFSEALVVTGVDSFDLTLEETKAPEKVKSVNATPKNGTQDEGSDTDSMVGLAEPLVVSDDEADASDEQIEESNLTNSIALEEENKLNESDLGNQHQVEPNRDEELNTNSKKSIQNDQESELDLTQEDIVTVDPDQTKDQYDESLVEVISLNSNEYEYDLVAAANEESAAYPADESQLELNQTEENLKEREGSLISDAAPVKRNEEESLEDLGVSDAEKEQENRDIENKSLSDKKANAVNLNQEDTPMDDSSSPTVTEPCKTNVLNISLDGMPQQLEATTEGTTKSANPVQNEPKISQSCSGGIAAEPEGDVKEESATEIVLEDSTESTTDKEQSSRTESQQKVTPNSSGVIAADADDEGKNDNATKISLEDLAEVTTGNEFTNRAESQQKDKANGLGLVAAETEDEEKQQNETEIVLERLPETTEEQNSLNNTQSQPEVTMNSSGVVVAEAEDEEKQPTATEIGLEDLSESITEKKPSGCNESQLDHFSKSSGLVTAEAEDNENKPNATEIAWKDLSESKLEKKTLICALSQPEDTPNSVGVVVTEAKHKEEKPNATVIALEDLSESKPETETSICALSQPEHTPNSIGVVVTEAEHTEKKPNATDIALEDPSEAITEKGPLECAETQPDDTPNTSGVDAAEVEHEEKKSNATKVALEDLLESETAKELTNCTASQPNDISNSSGVAAAEAEHEEKKANATEIVLEDLSESITQKELSNCVESQPKDTPNNLDVNAADSECQEKKGNESEITSEDHSESGTAKETSIRAESQPEVNQNSIDVISAEDEHKEEKENAIEITSEDITEAAKEKESNLQVTLNSSNVVAIEAEVDEVNKNKEGDVASLEVLEQLETTSTEQSAIQCKTPIQVESIIDKSSPLEECNEELPNQAEMHHVTANLSNNETQNKGNDVQIELLEGPKSTKVIEHTASEIENGRELETDSASTSIPEAILNTEVEVEEAPEVSSEAEEESKVQVEATQLDESVIELDIPDEEYSDERESGKQNQVTEVLSNSLDKSSCELNASCVEEVDLTAEDGDTESPKKISTDDEIENSTSNACDDVIELDASEIIELNTSSTQNNENADKPLEQVDASEELTLNNLEEVSEAEVCADKSLNEVDVNESIIELDESSAEDVTDADKDEIPIEPISTSTDKSNELNNLDDSVEEVTEKGPTPEEPANVNRGKEEAQNEDTNADQSHDSLSPEKLNEEKNEKNTKANINIDAENVNKSSIHLDLNPILVETNIDKRASTSAKITSNEPKAVDATEAYETFDLTEDDDADISTSPAKSNNDLSNKITQPNVNVEAAIVIDSVMDLDVSSTAEVEADGKETHKTDHLPAQSTPTEESRDKPIEATDKIVIDITEDIPEIVNTSPEISADENKANHDANPKTTNTNESLTGLDTTDVQDGQDNILLNEAKDANLPKAVDSATTVEKPLDDITKKSLFNENVEIIDGSPAAIANQSLEIVDASDTEKTDKEEDLKHARSSSEVQSGRISPEPIIELESSDKPEDSESKDKGLENIDSNAINNKEGNVKPSSTASVESILVDVSNEKHTKEESAEDKQEDIEEKVSDNVGDEQDSVPGDINTPMETQKDIHLQEEMTVHQTDLSKAMNEEPSEQAKDRNTSQDVIGSRTNKVEVDSQTPFATEETVIDLDTSCVIEKELAAENLNAEINAAVDDTIAESILCANPSTSTIDKPQEKKSDASEGGDAKQLPGSENEKDTKQIQKEVMTAEPASKENNEIEKVDVDLPSPADGISNEKTGNTNIEDLVTEEPVEVPQEKCSTIGKTDDKTKNQVANKKVRLEIDQKTDPEENNQLSTNAEPHSHDTPDTASSTEQAPKKVTRQGRKPPTPMEAKPEAELHEQMPITRRANADTAPTKRRGGRHDKEVIEEHDEKKPQDNVKSEIVENASNAKSEPKSSDKNDIESEQKSKRTRRNSTTEVAETEVVEEVDRKDHSVKNEEVEQKPKRTRQKLVAETAESETKVEFEAKDHAVEHKVEKPKRRGRLASVDVEETKPNLEDATTSEKPKRRARKPSADVAVDDAISSEKPKRRLRKPSAEVTDAEAHVKEEIDSEQPKRRGRRASLDAIKEVQVEKKTEEETIAEPVQNVQPIEKQLPESTNEKPTRRKRKASEELSDSCEPVEAAKTKPKRTTRKASAETAERLAASKDHLASIDEAVETEQKTPIIEEPAKRRGRRESVSVETVEEPSEASVQKPMEALEVDDKIKRRGRKRSVSAEPVKEPTVVETPDADAAADHKVKRRGRKKSISLERVEQKQAESPQKVVETPDEDVDDLKVVRRGRKKSISVERVEQKQAESPQKSVETLAANADADHKVIRRGRKKSISVERVEQKQVEPPQKVVEKPDADANADTDQKAKRRGRKKSTEQAEEPSTEPAQKVIEPPVSREKSVTRRGRKATADEDTTAAANVEPTEHKPKRRGQKTTVDEAHAEEPAQEPVGKVTRRGRKPSADVEHKTAGEAETPIEKKPTRRGRKPSANVDIVVEEPQTQPKKEATRRGRKRSLSAPGDEVDKQLDLLSLPTQQSVAAVSPKPQLVSSEDELTPRRREGRNLPRKNYDETSDEEKQLSARKIRKIASSKTTTAATAAKAAETETLPVSKPTTPLPTKRKTPVIQVEPAEQQEPKTPNVNTVTLPEPTSSQKREGRNVPRKNYNETSDDEKPGTSRGRRVRNPTAKALELLVDSASRPATPRRRKGKATPTDVDTEEPPEKKVALSEATPGKTKTRAPARRKVPEVEVEAPPTVEVATPMTAPTPSPAAGKRGARSRKESADEAAVVEAEQKQPAKRNARGGNTRKIKIVDEETEEQPTNKKARGGARALTPGVVEIEKSIDVDEIKEKEVPAANTKRTPAARARAARTVKAADAAAIVPETAPPPARTGPGRKVHFEDVVPAAAEPQPAAAEAPKRATRSRRK